MDNADLKPKEYSEYVQMELPHLKILEETYSQKISELEENSINTRVLKKYNIDLKKVLRFVLICFISFVSLFALLMAYVTFTKPSFSMTILLIFIVAVLIFVIPIVILSALSSENTEFFYRERTKIRPIITNKESKVSDKKINMKHVYIIKLLAKYSDSGLNREDLWRIMQKEFSKSIDKKTVDVYLEELSSFIERKNIHYKSKSSSKEYNDVPVYFLK